MSLLGVMAPFSHSNSQACHVTEECTLSEIIIWIVINLDPGCFPLFVEMVDVQNNDHRLWMTVSWQCNNNQE